MWGMSLGSGRTGSENEVERGVGVLQASDEEVIVDRDGSAAKLHQYDPRAVEFRERFALGESTEGELVPC